MVHERSFSSGVHERRREGISLPIGWTSFAGEKFVFMKSAGTFPAYPAGGREGSRLADPLGIGKLYPWMEIRHIFNHSCSLFVNLGSILPY
ncbi:hypothetical protein Y032_0765g2157 [Ancylostoma ceylanicum]|uniref:Uncharacterized protein n=1 Tax=Ancylostoma ceylanicum TaxID=53326 RepID=A0A016WDT6_9BILA|nr:hypothetical protein Y032_0765g2157 [Ancylostoma ceylanicum]